MNDYSEILGKVTDGNRHKKMVDYIFKFKDSRFALTVEEISELAHNYNEKHFSDPLTKEIVDVIINATLHVWKKDD